MHTCPVIVFSVLLSLTFRVWACRAAREKEREMCVAIGIGFVWSVYSYRAGAIWGIQSIKSNYSTPSTSDPRMHNSLH